MQKSAPFYDFCIPYNKNEKVMRDILTELVELGYKTIAIEEVYDHTSKNTAKKGSDQFPEPPAIRYLQDQFKNKLKILLRLTIIYVDVGVAHAMSNSMNLRKYNIIAGQPKTDAALTHCCTTFAGDLLTFDSEAGSKLSVNRKSFQIAVKRGMFFEIKYALAIRDSNNRKDMIKIAHNYCVRGKTRNVIFSSGARDPFELRGPYDVANLAYIFGLSADQGKNAIDRSCRELYLNATSRLIGKTCMIMEMSSRIADSSDEEDTDSDMEVVEKNEEGDEAPTKRRKVS